MAVDAILGVERVRSPVTLRPTVEQARSDRARTQQTETEDLQSKQIEQAKQAERDQVEQAAADKELQRAEAKKEVEREAEAKKQAEVEARRIEERRQAEIDRQERLQADREAERILQSRSERARLEGLNAYRAQTERVQQAAFHSVEQAQSEPAATIRSQVMAAEAARIDKIDLSDLARARLSGAVGLTIIQPPPDPNALGLTGFTGLTATA